MHRVDHNRHNTGNRKQTSERNQRYFGQVHGTFPTVPAFSEWINWGASSHTSDLILEGTFSPPDVDALTHELL